MTVISSTTCPPSSMIGGQSGTQLSMLKLCPPPGEAHKYIMTATAKNIYNEEMPQFGVKTVKSEVHDMSDSGKQAWIKAHPPAQEKEEAKGPPAPGKEAEAKEA